MAEHTFDIPTFRLLYPAFADATAFPDNYLQAQWDAGGVYLGTYDTCLVSGARRTLMLNLMAAHLTQLNVIIAAGGSTPSVGVLTSATVDKVTVTNAPPPIKNGWQQWLASTPYGLQLWGLLRQMAGAGFYLGGLPERKAFRKVGGVF